MDKNNGYLSFLFDTFESKGYESIVFADYKVIETHKDRQYLLFNQNSKIYLTVFEFRVYCIIKNSNHPMISTILNKLIDMHKDYERETILAEFLKSLAKFKMYGAVIQ